MDSLGAYFTSFVVKEDSDEVEYPPFMLVKSNGGASYQTTDLVVNDDERLTIDIIDKIDFELCNSNFYANILNLNKFKIKKIGNSIKHLQSSFL